MIQSKTLFTLVLLIGVVSTSVAQTRYLEDVGDEIVVTSNVVYGSNIGIISQTPALEELKMDLYQLAGDDTTTNKPVVIMLHTGSFLPAIANGQPTGDKTGNAIIEMCKRFAKKGYLAVALNYRLGWNPVSTSEDVRRSTLIQAAYRGLQDTKTAVRFLRKSAAEDGNPYGIGDKFAIGGYGTGGYLSLAVATLNDYESELLMPKFIDSSQETIDANGQPMPYIIQSVLGNFEATDFGMMPVDTTGDGEPDTQVTLCIPNHSGYSSEVDMVFNAGGALPDISWLEAGEVPIASMQNILDPDGPYAEGNVIVPTTGEFVIVAHGSKLIQEKTDSLGNNEVFEGLSTMLNDSWYRNGNGTANAAVALHNDLPGLFGMVTPTPSAAPTPCGLQAVQNAPWDWWDNTTYGTMADGYHETPPGTMGCLAILGNPDMSEEKGKAMANMMSDFFTPRVYAALIGTPVPITYGCTDESACNFNEEANYNDGSCIDSSEQEYYDCFGACLNDTDEDGICNELEIEGCTDDNACNFNVDATDDDESCVFILEVNLSYESDLIATSNAENPTYVWTLNGVELTNTQSQFLPEENGLYVVSIQDGGGCSGTASYSVEGIGIIESIKKSIKLYPNPADEFATINAQENIIYSAKIFSIEGKLVRKHYVNKSMFVLEKQELNRGFYIIELDINKKTFRKPIVFK